MVILFDQQVVYPRPVMAAQQVHQRIKEGGGVVFLQGANLAHHLARGEFMRQKADQYIPQGVVHHAVHGIAQHIAAHVAIGHFVAGVFPYLAQQHRVLILRQDGLAQFTQEGHGQLVRHIQPPAAGAGPDPVAGDAVLTHDELAVAGVGLVDFRQRGNAPPTGVLIGEVFKMIPGVIDRILALVGASRGVVAVAVEVQAVLTRMAEHAVQQYLDAHLLGVRAQALEVLLIAQHRVNRHIIARVIAVVGARLENGVQIQHRNPQVLQIGQFFADALQVAAKEVQRPVIPGAQIRGDERRLVPHLVHDAVLPLAHRQLAAIKAVREDLVHDALP